MKLIITENQYKLIENLIAEAKNTKLSPALQAKLGKAVLDILDNIGQGKVTEFHLESGNKVILNCVNDDNYVFTFNIVEDKANLFKKRDIITLKLNPGNGESDDAAYEYSLNAKVIGTSDNGQTFNLVFDAAKKTGVKGPVTLAKLVNVYQSSMAAPTPEPDSEDKSDDSGKDAEANVEEPKTPEPEEPKSKEEEKDLKMDANKALEMIVSDPIMKKAFYSQPTLWDLFSAELQGKKATGTGIITVLKLVNKYETKKIGAILKADFIPDKTVVFTPITRFQITYRVGKKKLSVNFDPSAKYKTQVLERKLSQNQKFIGTLDENLTYEIEILRRSEKTDEENVFTCNVGLYYDHKLVGMRQKYVDFAIDANESDGYKSLM